MFELRFVTSTYGPPRVVSFLTSENGWQPIAGRYDSGAWSFSLDEQNSWSDPSYFKLQLDGTVWMDGPYLMVSPHDGRSYTIDESQVRFSMLGDPPETPGLGTPLGGSAAGPGAPAGGPAGGPGVVAAAGGATAAPGPGETAMTNRVVALLTPFLTMAAAWLAGWVARKLPGVKLDQAQLVSFMISIAGVCLAMAYKWLHGWQQHELRVAQGIVAPLKPPKP